MPVPTLEEWVIYLMGDLCPGLTKAKQKKLHKRDSFAKKMMARGLSSGSAKLAAAFGTAGVYAPYIPVFKKTIIGVGKHTIGQQATGTHYIEYTTKPIPLTPTPGFKSTMIQYGWRDTSIIRMSKSDLYFVRGLYALVRHGHPITYKQAHTLCRILLRYRRNVAMFGNDVSMYANLSDSDIDKIVAVPCRVVKELPMTMRIEGNKIVIEYPYDTSLVGAFSMLRNRTIGEFDDIPSTGRGHRIELTMTNVWKLFRFRKKIKLSRWDIDPCLQQLFDAIDSDQTFWFPRLEHKDGVPVLENGSENLTIEMLAPAALPMELVINAHQHGVVVGKSFMDTIDPALRPFVGTLNNRLVNATNLEMRGGNNKYNMHDHYYDSPKVDFNLLSWDEVKQLSDHLPNHTFLVFMGRQYAESSMSHINLDSLKHNLQKIGMKNFIIDRSKSCYVSQSLELHKLDVNKTIVIGHSGIYPDDNFSVANGMYLIFKYPSAPRRKSAKHELVAMATKA